MTTTTTTSDKVCEFLSLFAEPDELVEVRCLYPSDDSQNRQFWWTPGEVAHEFDGIIEVNATHDVYFGANPRTSRGGSKEHVETCRAVFADFDDTDNANEADKRIKGAGLPKPTAVVSSGHGIHAYWRLAEPISPDEFEQIQVGIAAKVKSDSSVKDCSRVMRLPYTHHVKKDNAPCRLLYVNGATYPASDFPKGKARQRDAGQSLPPGTRADLPAWVCQILMNGSVQGQRDNDLFRAAANMAGNGFAREEIERRILDAAALCSPPLPDDEARRLINSALSKPREANVPGGVPATANQLQTAAKIDDAPGGDKPREFNCTDLGNAERLVHQYGHKLRFCHGTGQWLIWTGQRWREDGSGEVVRLAAKTVRNIYREAAEADVKGRRRELSSWAEKSESANRINALVSLARSRPGVAVTVDELDRDNWALNIANGTLDLRTGELRKHDPGDLITKLAPARYEQYAECPLWESFLARILADDDDLIGFMQRWLGHSLTGDVSEQYLPIFHGEGNNGKSVLLDSVRYIMGDYAGEAAPELLVDSRHGEHPTQYADLMGKRLVTASETEEGASLKLQLIKRLTGDARIKARYMRQDYFEFSRSHKLILVTNNRPRVRENSEAVWRRLRLVPFEVVIPKPERDGKLLDKLQGEASGILAWLVQGCLDWQRHGLGEAEKVTRATAHYRDDSDPINNFLTDCCELGDLAWEASGILRRVYEEWCSVNGMRPLGNHRYGDAMRLHGLDDGKQAGVRGWSGVQVSDEWYEITFNRRRGA